jgi:hypothetical protein
MWKIIPKIASFTLNSVCSVLTQKSISNPCFCGNIIDRAEKLKFDPSIIQPFILKGYSLVTIVDSGAEFLQQNYIDNLLGEIVVQTSNYSGTCLIKGPWKCVGIIWYYIN